MSDEKSEKSIQIIRDKRKSKYFTENLGNGISTNSYVGFRIVCTFPKT